MSVEVVRADLLQRGWMGEILEFAESSATVELAAKQAGTEPRRIAKTLAFHDPEAADQAILVVAAGDAKVNSGQFKRRFGGKPRMVQAHEVEALTGHPVGGVCPFANPAGTRVFLDESLCRFATVFPAAGTANSAVELEVEQLQTYTNAEGWVDISVNWREDEQA